MENISAGSKQVPKWEDNDPVSSPIGILISSLSISTVFPILFGVGSVKVVGSTIKMSGCQGQS